MCLRAPPADRATVPHKEDLPIARSALRAPLMWIAALSLVILVVAVPPAMARRSRVAKAAPSGPPYVSASSSILVDAVTGQVLFERNADAPRPPASTTKIMTSILLLEKVKPTDVITASKRASETGGSGLGLKPGEHLTAQDMLYALLLRSANDGCVAVAEHVAGSPERFAQMMTERAAQLGAIHTLFRNPDGLNAPPNTTTARDLAIMACFASKRPEFREATRSKYHTIARSSGSKDTVLRNHAKWLWRYAGADGVKTGYTAPAGRCFVGGATRNGWRLISVVLNCQEMYEATAKMMDYGFAAFEPVVAMPKGQIAGMAVVQGGTLPSVTAVAGEDVRCAVPRGRAAAVQKAIRLTPVTAPVAAGTRVGEVDLLLDGKVLSSCPLVAQTGVSRATVAGATGVASFFALVAALGTIGVGYASACAKGSRVRRSRVEARLRGDHRLG